MTDILANRINAINALHEYANKLIPQLMARVAQGYKVNAGGELHKKDKDALQAIIDQSNKVNQHQVWIQNSQYSGPIVHFKTNYMTSEHTCAYYEAYKYLNNEDKSDFQIYDLTEWRLKDNSLDDIRAKIEKLQDEVRAISKVTEGR